MWDQPESTDEAGSFHVGRRWGSKGTSSPIGIGNCLPAGSYLLQVEPCGLLKIGDLEEMIGDGW
jgi:hypothetical protein